MPVLTIFLSQLLWIAGLSGLGSIVLATTKQRYGLVFSYVHQTVFLSGIIGYLILTVAGSILNFIIPLNAVVSVLALLTGLLLFARNRFSLLQDFSRSDFILLAMLALLVMAMSLPGVTDSDTAVYHLQVIKWAKESTVPSGLANLHGRLGYNSLWFVSGAMLELPFGAKSPFVLNPVIMFFYAGLVLLHCKKRLKNILTPVDYFLFLTIVPWTWAFINNSVAATSSDLPVMLLTFLVFYLMAEQFDSEEENMPRIVMIFALSAFALTIKLSSLFLLIAAGVYAFLAFTKRFAASGWKLSVKPTFALLILSLLIFGPWIARGIVTSGCPAFPLHLGCFEDVQWAVPDAFVQYEEDFVKAFARDHDLTPSTMHSVLAGWDWLAVWAGRWFLGAEIIKIAPLLLLAASGICLALLRNRDHRNTTGSLSFIIIFSLAGAVFWFFSAPDFRFGTGYLYSLTIAFLSRQIACLMPPDEVLVKGRRVVSLLLVFLISAIAFNFGRLALTGTRFASIPEADLSRVAFIDSVPVYYPPKGDCWDAPLPCTTFLDKGLRIDSRADGLPQMFWFEKADDFEGQ